MKKRIAVAAAKAAGAASRASGRGGGTTIPGDVARAVDPGILKSLASQLTQGVIVVTGTNGKTTTSRLIAEVLRRLPARVVANASGANLMYGATAAAVAAARWDGSLNAEWGVFEIDEASLGQAVDELRPRLVVVTNLFRDQLDRYGELETVALRMEGALRRLPPGARVVLNADDPRVAELGRRLPSPPLWFGLDDPSVSARELPHAADARTCPLCGRALEFRAIYVGHDGEWRCPAGDLRRPALDVAATEIVRRGLGALAMKVLGIPFSLALGGLYNAYNATAAIAALQALGVDLELARRCLGEVRPAFGRQERFERGGRAFTLLLAKNPTGFNELLREAAISGAHSYLIGLNDNLADGRDVSWIWDVDFEVLRGAARVWPTGKRAADLAVRLKYAEVPAKAPTESLTEALDAFMEELPQASEGHILLTYSALLDLRRLLHRRGWLSAFWAA